MGNSKAVKKLKYGLIGDKLSHSFSKSFFEQRFYKQHLVEGEYSNYVIDNLARLKTFVKHEALDLDGFNITIPYKEVIIPFLDKIDESARIIKAVNTVYNDNNCLIGYNTDWLGFVESVKSILPDNKKLTALVFGTGGASKAVVFGLETLNIDYQLVSSSNKSFLNYENIDKQIMLQHQLLINTTPLGMYPKINSCIDIPYEYITKAHIAFDLIYNPAETLFLKKVKSQGGTILNGLQMLQIQAHKAWDIWLKKYV